MKAATASKPTPEMRSFTRIMKLIRILRYHEGKNHTLRAAFFHGWLESAKKSHEQAYGAFTDYYD